MCSDLRRNAVQFFNVVVSGAYLLLAIIRELRGVFLRERSLSLLRNAPLHTGGRCQPTLPPGSMLRSSLICQQTIWGLHNFSLWFVGVVCSQIHVVRLQPLVVKLANVDVQGGAGAALPLLWRVFVSVVFRPPHES